MVSDPSFSLSRECIELSSLYVQPQNEYIEQFRKRHGYRFDHFEKK